MKGFCKRPHYFGPVREDHKAILQVPHEEEDACRDWKPAAALPDDPKIHETPKPKIDLVLTPEGYGSKIIVDGVELRGVRRAGVVVEAGRATAVTVELVALGGVSIVGEASKFESRIRLMPTLRAWLSQLWHFATL